MRYFIVTAKCGHVGKGKYIDVQFPIIAENASDAARIILKRTKVKKHLKNAITSVIEVRESAYFDFIYENPYESYLSAHSSREFNLDDYEIKKLETCNRHKKQEFSSRKERVSFILKKHKLNLTWAMVGDWYDAQWWND